MGEPNIKSIPFECDTDDVCYALDELQVEYTYEMIRDAKRVSIEIDLLTGKGNLIIVPKDGTLIK